MTDIVPGNNTFDYEGTIEIVTVEQTGIYEIIAYGAAGGVGGQGGAAGEGAEIEGDFSLTQGEVIEILVGGVGASGVINNDGGGGGGGSFVIETSDGTTSMFSPLVIAGGGGGGGLQGNASGGTTGTGGADGDGGAGGGFRSGFNGGGGGGLNTDGVDGQVGEGGFSGFGGASYSGGGGGGIGDTSTNGGGFGGGGGGGGWGGGGGGGYSGGAGGSGDGIGFGGAGGGSLDTGTDQTLIGSENAGVGLVTIDLESPVCYLRGTRILTRSGEVPVEDLQQGDMLVTRFGPLRPVKWIGQQRFAGAFLGKRLAPVRIRAGALGENVPYLDLIVSPAHSMLLDERLVLAELLVNGVTITQDATSEQVDYFHIDLGVHDCVVANGAWSESYAEHANRGMFHNAAAFAKAFPDHQAEYQPMCLPRVDFASNAALPAIAALVLARVPADHVTVVADVHLLANGRRIEPTSVEGNRWMFRVPAGVAAVSLRSHAASPAAIAENGDLRSLGICVSSLTACSAAASVTCLPEGPALRDGWHDLEGVDDIKWRWTDGHAVLSLHALFALPFGDTLGEVELTIAAQCLPRYLLTDVPVTQMPEASTSVDTASRAMSA